MKTLYKVLHKGKILTAKSCTDKECTEKSNKGDNKNLAPLSHGFVNLFDGTNHIAWCGTNYATEHRILNT